MNTVNIRNTTRKLKRIQYICNSHPITIIPYCLCSNYTYVPNELYWATFSRCVRCTHTIQYASQIYIRTLLDRVLLLCRQSVTLHRCMYVYVCTYVHTLHTCSVAHAIPCIPGGRYSDIGQCSSKILSVSHDQRTATT